MADQRTIERIEAALAALKAGDKSATERLINLIGGDAITVGNIEQSKAVAIGRDIQIILQEQPLPDDLLLGLQVVLDTFREEPELRALLERRRGQHIFLSYARADIEKVRQIRSALEAAGHHVWQDMTAIKGGDEWIKSIEEGIKRAYALVTVVSEESMESEWVRIEYLQAERRNKPVIPIQVDDCEIPMELLDKNIQSAHLDLEGGIRSLLAALPDPPPEDEEAPEPTGLRELEIQYLDRLLLKHSVWQNVYTPMAGVGQMRIDDALEETSAEMVVTPTTIDVDYLADLFANGGNGNGQPHRIEEKLYEADIIPAVEEMRRLVILGDPGAGKTTTLWRIVSDYALRAKEDPVAPLPVFIRLDALGGYDDLEMTIKSQLGALAPHYQALFDSGRMALLLDGLNELPAANREANLAAIRALVERCAKGDMVATLTCRALDYTGALDMGIPRQVVIQPLDPLRIRRFCNAYITEPPGKGDELFWQLAGGEQVREMWEVWEKAGATFELFWSAEDIPRENPDVFGSTPLEHDFTWREFVQERSRSMLTLASNPYMLYMIALVFTQSGMIPKNRGLLFRKFVDYLFTQREKLARDAAAELERRLADLAYAMQAGGEGMAFSRGLVVEYLGDDLNLYRAQSANILTGDKEVRFTHQLLQEYLAAHSLELAIEKGLAAADLFPPESWWEPQSWEETVVLLAGLFNDDCTSVLGWLKEAQPELVARCVVESGAHTPDETRKSLGPLWRPRLTDLQRDPRPEARAAVGRALGVLDLDDRPGVGLREDGLPDIMWVEIPGGEIIFGTGEEGNGPTTLELPTFCIAKFPTTFAQFQTFIDDDGYENDEWWEGLDAPEDHRDNLGEQAFKYANHPRENVSWYEAVAFCRWLTARLKERDLLPPMKTTEKEEALWRELGYDPEKVAVRLPDEREWEKAARGTDGREYPYEGEFDAGKGNTHETGILQTSAVGIFPQGASPYGVLDMSGNVWEWCRNKYEPPIYIGLAGEAKRVVRGGSWAANVFSARAVDRYFRDPLLRVDGNGFRVALAAAVLE